MTQGGMGKNSRAVPLWALSGLVGLLMITAACAVIGESIDPPRVVAGKVSLDQADGMRPLASSEVAIISDWLAQHHSGWTVNVVTLPPPTVYFSLDTASQRAALTLALWSGLKYPSLDHAVIFEYPARKTILKQSFSDRELAPLLGLVAR